MVVNEFIKNSGWHLNERGLNVCLASANKATTPVQKKASVEGAALNLDLYKFGEACIPDLKKEAVSQLSEDMVLQVSKVRNVSAPTYNQTSEHAPRMLTLFLTDGKKNLQCVEHEKLLGVSVDTPPGTKIKLLSGTRVTKQGVFLLEKNRAKILGGKVDALITKWKANMKRDESAQQFNSSNPPPAFVPFGKCIDARYEKGTVTRGLLADEDDKQEKEESQFDIDRKNVIDNIGQKNTKRFDNKNFQSKGEESLGDNSGNAKKLPQVEQNFSRRNNRKNNDRFEKKDRYNTRDNTFDDKDQNNLNNSTYSEYKDRNNTKNNTYFENNDRSNTRKNTYFENEDRNSTQNNTYVENKDNINTLMEMGFNYKLASEQLRVHKGSITDALESLLNGKNDQRDQFGNKDEGYNKNNSTNKYNKNNRTNKYNKNTSTNSYKKSESNFDKKNKTSFNNQFQNMNINKDFSSRQKYYEPNQNSNFKEKQTYYKDENKGKNRSKQQFMHGQRPLNTNNNISDRPSVSENANLKTKTTNSNKKISANTTKRNDNFYNCRERRLNNEQIKRNNDCGDKNFTKNSNNKSSNRNYSAKQNNANSNRNEFKQNKFNQGESAFNSSNLNKRSNLPPRMKNSQGFSEKPNSPRYAIGDKVMAKYWEDGKFYEATIVNVHQTEPFAVVQFDMYGNCEEVGFNEIFTGRQPSFSNQPQRFQNNYNW